MSFDALAPYYSGMERILAGGKLHRCRTAYLEQARSARSILLVGEGHGRFLAEVCRINPDASISYVDASPEMLRVAQERLASDQLSQTKVQFYCAPILDFEPEQSFDLVATHFFLDCFPSKELKDVVSKISSFITPSGRWIVSDFQVPERGWRHLRARLVLALAYSFFRVATRLPAKRLVPPAPYLLEQGLVPLEKRELNFGLLYSQLWEKPLKPKQRL